MDNDELKMEAAERVLKLILEEKETATKELKQVRTDEKIQVQQLTAN